MAAAYTPQIGHGGSLQIDVAYPATPSLTTIGLVVDFGTSIDVTEVDVSHQQSPEAAALPAPLVQGPFWAEFIPGKITVEITFSLIADVGQLEHEDTLLDHIGVVRQWTYTWRDESVWLLTGFYKTLGFTVPNEDKGTIDVTVRCTGKPSFTGDPNP